MGRAALAALTVTIRAPSFFIKGPWIPWIKKKFPTVSSYWTLRVVKKTRWVTSKTIGFWTGSRTALSTRRMMMMNP